MKIENRRGSVFVIALIVMVILAVIAGIWYYEARQSSPLNNGNSTTSTGAGVVKTSQPASTSLTIIPVSGPAGTMIVLGGRFSVCGNQADQCTEDRFDEPVFLQNGLVVATSVVSYIPIEGSGTANDPFRQNGNTAYQVPFSLAPGNYEFAMQNCLGKSCNNYHISSFTVVAPSNGTVPAITSIDSPILSSSSLAGATITIHGNNFSTSDNYISFVGDGTTGGDGSSINYNYIADVASPDGKTITLRLPSCSASSGPTCEWVPNGAYWTSDNGYRIAVSNSNGTSNFVLFKTQ